MVGMNEDDKDGNEEGSVDSDDDDVDESKYVGNIEDNCDIGLIVDFKEGKDSNGENDDEDSLEGSVVDTKDGKKAGKKLGL